MKLKATQRKAIDTAFQYKSTKYIKFTPTVKQQIFLCLDDLEVFFGGSAGGGKTLVLLMAALQYVDMPKYNAILIRDTYANLSKPDSLMFMAEEWLRNTDAHWNGTDKRWTFPSGSTLSFGYMDHPMAHFNYQSSQFQFIGFDEVVAIREYQYLYMFSRLRKLEGCNIPLRVRSASNPPTREQLATGEWVKRRFVDDKTREPGVLYVPSKMNDNPHLNKDEYRKNLAKLDSVTKKQLEDGDWEIRAKGRMFDRSWFKFIKVPPAMTGHAIRYWDMAATEKTDKNEPCFTAGCKIYKFDLGYVIEDMARAQKGPGKLDAMLRSIAQTDGLKTHIYMEQEPGSAGVIAIDYFRSKVLPGYTFYADKVTGGKVERAYPLAAQAEAGKIWLVEGPWNKPFLDEIEIFPDGLFKDQVDATSGGYNKLEFGSRGVSVGSA
jgi:predicted phage terminase large subunit-like protein